MVTVFWTRHVHLSPRKGFIQPGSLRLLAAAQHNNTARDDRLQIRAQPEAGQPDEGATVQLPSATPIVSYGFAAATCILTPPFLLFGAFEDTLLLYPGWLTPNWLCFVRLLTTQFLCYDFAPMLAGGLLLATAGAAAERVLGPGRFAAIFLLSGAAKCVWDMLSLTADALLDVLPLEEVLLTYTSGPAAGALGLAAAVGAVQLKNRRLLSVGQHREWALALAAATVLAQAAEQATLSEGYVAAAIVGGVLGGVAGPRFELPPREAGAARAPPGAEGRPAAVLAVERPAPVRQWAAYILIAALLVVLAKELELLLFFRVLLEDPLLDSLIEDMFRAEELERLRELSPDGALPLEPLLEGLKGLQA